MINKPNFELIRHDVVEKILLEVDQVYHLACPASPVHYKYNPIKTIKTSFLGTMNMLGLAKVHFFVFFCFPRLSGELLSLSFSFSFAAMLLDLSVCARAVPRGAELGSFVSSPSFVHSLFSFCSLFFFPPKKLHPQHQRTRARFLLTSTSEVYGDPLEHPQTESYWGNVNPIGERSCYDEGKRAAECLTFDYRREHGLDVRVCRIFNTYGPRMALDDGRVVSNFVAQALTGQPMTVYGDGQQTRSFQYVSDLIAGMVAVMEGTRDILVCLCVF